MYSFLINQINIYFLMTIAIPKIYEREYVLTPDSFHVFLVTIILLSSLWIAEFNAPVFYR